MRVCNDCLFIVFKMQNYKIIMNCKKKMSIMPIINFAKGASRTGSVSHTGKIFGKVCVAKSDTFELSEGNGKFRKRVERSFGEKRL